MLYPNQVRLSKKAAVNKSETNELVKSTEKERQTHSASDLYVCGHWMGKSRVIHTQNKINNKVSFSDILVDKPPR